MASGLFSHKEAPHRSPEWYFKERQRRRALKMGLDGYAIRVGQIALRDNLFHCWQVLKKEGGQAPGIDHYTYREIGPDEVGDIVADLSEQAQAGLYQPQRVREVNRPKPGTNKFRTLRIGTLCDRVMGKAVDEAFSPFWKKRFLPNSYAYRKRRGPWDLLAHLEVAIENTDRRVLAVDDIEKAFDNVPVEAVVECHRQALHNVKQQHFDAAEKERTVALIEAVIRGHDTKKVRGIDQGAPFSPTVLNVLLHYHHDTRIKKEISTSLPWFRYSDNLAYLCQSMSEGEQTLKKVSALLSPLGLKLKGEDGVKDLNQGDVAHLMGLSLWLNGKSLNYELEPSTFKHLQQSLGSAHVAPNPPMAARTAYVPR